MIPENAIGGAEPKPAFRGNKTAIVQISQISMYYLGSGLRKVLPSHLCMAVSDIWLRRNLLCAEGQFTAAI
jgi:hypothetical protein